MADEKTVDEVVEETEESQAVLEEATESVDTEPKEERKLTPMEENWIFYMYAGIPWHESKKIENEEERQFLLSRCWEMKVARETEQQKTEERERQMEDNMMAVQNELQDKMGSLPTIEPKDLNE